MKEHASSGQKSQYLNLITIFFLKKLSHPYSLKTSFKKDFYIFNIS